MRIRFMKRNIKQKYFFMTQALILFQSVIRQGERTIQEHKNNEKRFNDFFDNVDNNICDIDNSFFRTDYRKNYYIIEMEEHYFFLTVYLSIKSLYKLSVFKNLLNEFKISFGSKNIKKTSFNIGYLKKYFIKDYNLQFQYIFNEHDGSVHTPEDTAYKSLVNLDVMKIVEFYKKQLPVVKKIHDYYLEELLCSSNNL